MVNITKQELQQLYVVENKTDKEIALKFGVKIFNICYLRKKYDIKGINIKHRKLLLKPQVDISNRQKSIIFGSLLGDASLKHRYGSVSYLAISHSGKQKQYIDWLYNELKSICNSPPKKYISCKKYITYEFTTESRKDLLELRNKIYTPQKTITKWWLDQLDELSLAIWFMDDGTLSYVNKSKSIFSFATNSFSLEENYLLSAFLKNRFQIDSEVKAISRNSGVQYNLLISDSSFVRFAEIIGPYIIPDMLYKLPGDEHIANLIKNMGIKITAEKLHDLYCNKNLTQTQIGKILNVHKTTVSKYMDIFSIQARCNSESQLCGKNNRVQRSDSGRFAEFQIEDDDVALANKIFEEIRKNGFPYVDKKSSEHYIAMLDKMCGEKICNLENQIYLYSKSGMEMCSSFCPQIFSMSAIGSKSPLEIFKEDVLLLDCIKRTIKYAKKDTIASVRNGLKTYKNNRCVTIFPPMWAKTVIKKYFGEKKGISVLDFSCGFGGRLIGCYASGIVKKYVGVDPLLENINSHNEIYSYIQKHSELKKNGFCAEFLNDTAENFFIINKEKFDLIITSPPYFNKEIYSKDQSQCYIKYPNYSSWKNNWFEPVLSNAFGSLNNNGKMIIFASNSSNTVGDDCCAIMAKISSQIPETIRFSVPSLEYFRAKPIKKFDIAHVICKTSH